MKKAGFIAVVLGCLWPASAGAHTTITCDPCSFPYQQWVDQAKVPTPDVTLAVVETRCPDADADACTRKGDYTIWFDPVMHPREAFLHELGHNFDYYNLTDEDREQIARILGTFAPWNGPPKEWFAGAYADCGLGQPWRYRAPKRARRLCRFLKA